MSHAEFCCQFIEQNPTADDARKCGKPTVMGQPYCAEHLGRVWYPKREPWVEGPKQ